MPLLLLLPAAGEVEAPQDFPGIADPAADYGEVDADSAAACSPEPSENTLPSRFDRWPMRFVARGFEPEGAFQVRIEQRMTIRIAPRGSIMQPDAFFGVPSRPIGPRFVERKMGSCIPISRISGVQANGGNNLLLFLSDSRIVTAQLDRSCQARDFYSGFYLSRNDDDMLCVNRDTLQSRSGAHCHLTRIRQLVEVGN